MKSKKKVTYLSVVLATFNEEANIGRCLEAVKAIADEIVIVDGQSQDETVKIAKSFGAKILSRPNPSNFHINKNIAIAEATGEWILQLDADEVVSTELSQEIAQTIASQPSENGFWVNRRNWFLGRFLTKGGQYPDPTLRFYRRGTGRLPAADVHEQAIVQGQVGHFKHDLFHYRDTSFEKYLVGFNRYSSFIADQLQSRDTPFNLLTTLNYLFAKPLLTFIKIYIRHKGFVDGFPGFVFAIFSGLIHSVAYIKYWQHKFHPS